MSIHGAVDLGNCIKMIDIVNGTVKIEGTEFNITLEQYENFIELTGANKDDVYFDPKVSIHPFFIYLEGCMIEVHSFEPDMLEFLQIPNRIKVMTHSLRNAIMKKDFISLFGIIDKRARIPELVKRLHSIPVEQVYDVFEYVYTSSEQGFHLIPKKVIKHIKSYAHLSGSYIESMRLLKQFSNDEGKLPIYRGHNENSNENVSQAIQSWTLSENTAKYFATRFKGNHHVEFMIVPVEDILFYFDGRGEQEVIIFA